MIEFGLPSALATLPQLFSLKLDQMMVAAVLSSRDLGVYMVAIAWGGCIPIFVGDDIAATISSSGEPDVVDHAVIAEAVRRFTVESAQPTP